MLEQGRALHPSREVLQNLAEAVHLTPNERNHLFVLAEGPPLVETCTSNDQVGPALRRALGALNPLPAYVIGRRWDFLAWNTSAERVLLLSQSVPPYERNAIWRMFANPLAQQLYHPKWEQEARDRARGVPCGECAGCQ